MAELLCTIEQVEQAWLNFQKLPDPEQADLINAASQKIMDFLRRDFLLQQPIVETLDGNNQSRLWLSTRPVVSIQSITVNGDPIDNTFGDAWIFKPKTGEVVLGAGQDDPRFAPWFPNGKQNIVIMYTAGYLIIPTPIIRATIWMVRYLSEQTQISGLYQSEALGDWSYTIREASIAVTVPLHVASILASYVQDDGPV